jgi:hypothetical protein
MCGAIPPLPQYTFMEWCLVKHRDNFTFTFILVALVQPDGRRRNHHLHDVMKSNNVSYWGRIVNAHQIFMTKKPDISMHNNKTKNT